MYRTDKSKLAVRLKSISMTVTQSRWYYGAMPVSTLYRPAGADDRCRINTRYTLYMQEVQGPAKSFNDHWIELGYYTGWYPVCNGNRADY